MGTKYFQSFDRLAGFRPPLQIYELHFMIVQIPYIILLELQLTLISSVNRIPVYLVIRCEGTSRTQTFDVSPRRDISETFGLVVRWKQEHF